MRGKVSSFLFISAFLITNLLAQPPVVAVLDFEAKGDLPPELGSEVADVFRDELAKTGEYAVIDKVRIQKVLHDQRFIQRVLDEETARWIGELLNAKYVVIGSIMKIGTGVERNRIYLSSPVYTINVQFINTQTGGIKFAESASVNNIEDLAQACETIVAKLTGKEEIPHLATPQTKPETHYQPEPSREEVSPADVCRLAQLDAQQEINSLLWFGAGFLMGLTGVIIAYIYTPEPSALKTMGHSPEWIAYYRDCYRRKARDIQTRNACTGYLTYLGIVSCCYFYLLSMEPSEY